MSGCAWTRSRAGCGAWSRVRALAIALCLVEVEGRGRRPMQTSCWQAAAAQLPSQQLAACRHWLPRTHDATHCINHAIIAIARWKSHCVKQRGTAEKSLQWCHSWRRCTCLQPAQPQAAVQSLAIHECRNAPARGAAAFKQILVTWQRGQDVILTRGRNLVP